MSWHIFNGNRDPEPGPVFLRLTLPSEQTAHCHAHGFHEGLSTSEATWSPRTCPPAPPSRVLPIAQMTASSHDPLGLMVSSMVIHLWLLMFMAQRGDHTGLCKGFSTEGDFLPRGIWQFGRGVDAPGTSRWRAAMPLASTVPRTPRPTARVSQA